MTLTNTNREAAPTWTGSDQRCSGCTSSISPVGLVDVKATVKQRPAGLERRLQDSLAPVGCRREGINDCQLQSMESGLFFTDSKLLDHLTRTPKKPRLW
jgi:hypothetical protein